MADLRHRIIDLAFLNHKFLSICDFWIPLTALCFPEGSSLPRSSFSLLVTVISTSSGHHLQPYEKWSLPICDFWIPITTLFSQKVIVPYCNHHFLLWSPSTLLPVAITYNLLKSELGRTSYDIFWFDLNLTWLCLCLTLHIIIWWRVKT